MILHVVEARYEHDYVVFLKFNDGAEGYVDLADELYGEMFASLRDREKFAAVRIDPELGTVVWTNGADLAPEFLHDRLLVPTRREPDNSPLRTAPLTAQK
jgi:hypothetical protein